MKDTTEKQDRAQLFNELLENINRQLEMDIELKEIMELLFKDNIKSTKSRRIQDKVDAVKKLFIEAESVQAEGRAIFHKLFGTGFEY
jgi:transcriptional regulator CtsR